MEIEIKVQIENSKDLMNFLKKEARFVTKDHQIDKYYYPIHRKFTEVRPVNEWLRLRNSAGKYSINYKNWHREKDGRTHYCDEYEGKIENIEELEKIFKVLDMQPLVEVDKEREIWRYKEFEVSIDSVKELGDFVEIEYKGDTDGRMPAKVTAEMVEFLRQFNPGKIVKNYVGYPFQLLFPSEIVTEVV